MDDISRRLGDPRWGGGDTVRIQGGHVTGFPVVMLVDPDGDCRVFFGKQNSAHGFIPSSDRRSPSSRMQSSMLTLFLFCFHPHKKMERGRSPR